MVQTVTTAEKHQGSICEQSIDGIFSVDDLVNWLFDPLYRRQSPHKHHTLSDKSFSIMEPLIIIKLQGGENCNGWVY